MERLFILIGSTLAIMILCQFTLISDNRGSGHFSDSLKPKISLTLAGSAKMNTWGQQIRYRIQVQDKVDGDSKYNEIDADEVFLGIRFFPGARDSADLVNKDELQNLLNSEGLIMMGRGACFGCHGVKTSKIGPSFEEIENLVAKQNSSKMNLVNSIRNGSVGKWGKKEMPSNPSYSEKETRKIVDFILEQGRCQDCQIYLGLEGAFQITKRPNNVNTGLYLLTASYTSSNGEQGTDSMLLKIR
jgi:cytochrome c551/c552